MKDGFWDRVFTTEEAIDVKKIDTSSGLESYSNEQQAEIEKIYHDGQKNENVDGNNKEKNIEMLRKAWNAKGSPFVGQEFDPNVVSFGTE